MPCSHFGGAEDKWNITPFCSFLTGAGTEKTERANAPVRGSGINLASRYGNVSRAGYPETAALYAYLVGHNQAPR
jgi:hypothetical protein